MPVSPVIRGCGSAALSGPARRTASARKPSVRPDLVRQTRRMAEFSRARANPGARARLSTQGTSALEFAGASGIGPGRERMVNNATGGRAATHGSSGHRQRGFRGPGDRPPSRAFLQAPIPILALKRHTGSPRRSARREKPAESVRSGARSGSPTGPSGRNMRSMRRSGAMSTTARSATWKARRRFRSAAWPNPASSRRSCSASRPRPSPAWTSRRSSAASTGSPTASRSCSRSSRTGRSEPADTVAAYGLHGRLLIGPRHPAQARRRRVGARALALRDRSLPQRGPGRSRRRGQRPRRAASCVASSRRDAGAGSAQSACWRRVKS